MKIVGLITEYNPFHNGHKYHIEKAKEITGADYCIAVMSGDFVQRGAPAFMPKHLRAEMALHEGCDMVIELPVCYATGSAEYFAKGAISILNGLGCVDAVCFGSECGNYESLEQIAQILADEPSGFKHLLQTNLRKGMNFPQARQDALITYINDPSVNTVIKEPNNILGIEYIKAMKNSNSFMKGYTISRKGASYHDSELSDTFSSASAIRSLLSENEKHNIDKFSGHLPDSAFKIMEENFSIRFPVVSDDFSLLLRSKLLSETKESLTEYIDITRDLANRIINERNKFIKFTQFCDLLKTKELTYSRISRCLIHILLNMKKNTLPQELYAHVLGFHQKSSSLFSELNKCSTIPLITKMSSLDQDLTTDIFASDLYESVISDKYNMPFVNELSKPILKISD